MVSNVSSESATTEDWHSERDHSVGLKFSLASTPSKPTGSVVISPSSPGYTLSDDSSHSDNTSEIDEFDASTVIKRIGKSDHKIAEEQGLHEEEPLLKENPHRFVLFPIEDNEVSSVDYMSLPLRFAFNILLTPCCCSDLGHVQKGRSLFLDCRRN